MTGDVPHAFRNRIRTIEALRKVVPEPTLNITYDKVLGRLDTHCQTLISASPYAVLATCDERGRCDASPRGGRPGFIRILDDNCLLIPELSGNRRADTLRNLILNPSIGLFFLVPGYEDILRVNGRGYVIDDRDLLDSAQVDGKHPNIAIGIHVVEAYMHCAKAAKRASLWQPENWPAFDGIASTAQILRDHTQGSVGDGTTKAIQDILDESYRKRLFEPGWE